MTISILCNQKKIVLQEENERLRWRDSRLELVYPGVDPKKTVLEATMEALSEKKKFGIRDNAFNAESKRISRLLPQPNLYPPSLYAMKEVVGVEPLQNYEEHMCVNTCQSFKKLPPGEWFHNKDER